MKINMLIVGEIGTNCYILVDEETNKGAIIDPGGDAPQILEAVEKIGVTITHVLLTHGHYDHTTAVPEMREAFPDADIYIHKDDANGTGNRLFPLAGRVDDLKFYDEGDVVKVGSLAVEVIHTPGHSKGGVTLRVGDALFVGDTLFAGNCGRTDLPGGNYEEILQSLKRLAMLEGNFHVLPGHEETSSMERERRQNPYIREAMQR